MDFSLRKAAVGFKNPTAALDVLRYLQETEDAIICGRHVQWLPIVLFLTPYPRQGGTAYDSGPNCAPDSAF